ncbi:MAG TPA: winged helix-turn-helix domain-containing protein [Nitrososphaeraceae archaeon]|jgi:predicted transcriptional regulator|nr:winged helix-turn-helix domain-containing protein [Nitrososphaeraceae archaeon]
MAYRSREEIFASILRTAGSGGRITRSKIMFGSYLTYAQVVEYTKMLIERGLLEYDPLDRTFKTTPSGFTFTQLQNEMSQMIKIRNIVK